MRLLTGLRPGQAQAAMRLARPGDAHLTPELPRARWRWTRRPRRAGRPARRCSSANGLAGAEHLRPSHQSESDPGALIYGRLLMLGRSDEAPEMKLSALLRSAPPLVHVQIALSLN
jgi:hypothetical protein